MLGLVLSSSELVSIHFACVLRDVPAVGDARRSQPTLPPCPAGDPSWGPAWCPPPARPHAASSRGDAVGSRHCPVADGRRVTGQGPACRRSPSHRQPRSSRGSRPGPAPAPPAAPGAGGGLPESRGSRPERPAHRPCPPASSRPAARLCPRTPAARSVVGGHPPCRATSASPAAPSRARCAAARTGRCGAPPGVPPRRPRSPLDARRRRCAGPVRGVPQPVDAHPVDPRRAPPRGLLERLLCDPLACRGEGWWPQRAAPRASQSNVLPGVTFPPGGPVGRRSPPSRPAG